MNSKECLRRDKKQRGPYPGNEPPESDFVRSPAAKRSNIGGPAERGITTVVQKAGHSDRNA